MRRCSFWDIPDELVTPFRVDERYGVDDFGEGNHEYLVPSELLNKYAIGGRLDPGPESEEMF